MFTGFQITVTRLIDPIQNPDLCKFNIRIPLTADKTNITADSTAYTADRTFEDGGLHPSCPILT